jgi:hypothetical protein
VVYAVAVGARKKNMAHYPTGHMGPDALKASEAAAGVVKVPDVVPTVPEPAAAEPVVAAPEKVAEKARSVVRYAVGKPVDPGMAKKLWKLLDELAFERRVTLRSISVHAKLGDNTVYGVRKHGPRTSTVAALVRSLGSVKPLSVAERERLLKVLLEE